MIAAVVGGGVLLGCSSAEPERAAPEPTAESAPDDDAPAAFPVTIAHRHGATTIDRRPERVVTVGLTDQDALLAVGVAPVGTTEWFGDHPGAIWPWATDELAAIDGATTPAIVGRPGTIDYEAIAALAPDLILAVYGGLTETEYSTLSELAPTVAQPDAWPDFGVPWQEQTRTIGAAVGRTAEAEAAVESTEAAFARARDAHPEFEGRTGLVVVPGTERLSVYAAADPRGRLLGELGFRGVDGVEELADDGIIADVSIERVDLVDVDVLVMIVNDVERDRERVRAEPLFRSLRVAAEGRDVYVANLDPVGGATSFVTVSSLPFLLDELVPRLAAAVDGDPTTVVR